MKKTALMIMIVTVISKVFGFLRDLILSYFYGATGVSDAYLIAMTIPGVIFSFIGIGIINGFIPMYTNIENDEGTIYADRFTNNLTNITTLFTGIMFILGIVFTEPLVKIFASGFSGETLELAVLFSRITMGSIFFVALTYIFSGYLQIKESYVISSMTGLPLNFFMVTSIVISSRGNVKILAIGSLFAAMSQFIFLVPSIIKKGFKYQFMLDFKDKNIKRMMLLVLPLVMGSSVNQINVLIDRTLASRISVGGISAMNYANKLNSFVITLFVTSIVTVMYPMISKMAAKKDMDGLKDSVSSVVSTVVVVVVPAMVMAMIFSNEIVEILFKRGSFDESAAIMTSNALFYFAIGMLGFGLNEVLSRVFYSIQDTKTPVVIGVIAMGVNIVLNLILSRYMGISGLALATSLSALVSTLIMTYLIVKKVGSLGVKRISVTIIKVLISSLTMGAVSYFIFNILSVKMANLFALALASAVGISAYVLVAFLIRVEEINKGISLLKSKIVK